MTLPTPIPGLVVHYSFLWHEQREQGLDEGTKERPCLVVSVECCPDGTTLVAVAPLTHRPPQPTMKHVALPGETKRRLGLWRGQVWVSPDFDDPLPEFEQAFYGELGSFDEP